MASPPPLLPLKLRVAVAAVADNTTTSAIEINGGCGGVVAALKIEGGGGGRQEATFKIKHTQF